LAKALLLTGSFSETVQLGHFLGTTGGCGDLVDDPCVQGGQKMDPRTQELIDLMKENITQKITVADLDRNLPVSYSRLRCMFKSDTGLSPAHYLSFLRWRKAEELLLTSQLRIKQIAYAVGLNESHFVRIFKHVHGLTPTEFRTRAQAEKGE
jgi:transcriptional regulator GlxA family with amidase domain